MRTGLRFWWIIYAPLITSRKYLWALILTFFSITFMLWSPFYSLSFYTLFFLLLVTWGWLISLHVTYQNALSLMRHAPQTDTLNPMLYAIFENLKLDPNKTLPAQQVFCSYQRRKLSEDELQSIERFTQRLKLVIYIGIIVINALTGFIAILTVLSLIGVLGILLIPFPFPSPNPTPNLTMISAVVFIVMAPITLAFYIYWFREMLAQNIPLLFTATSGTTTQEKRISNAGLEGLLNSFTQESQQRMDRE